MTRRPGWKAEWADSLDEELEMEIDDLLIAKDLAFISELKHKSPSTGIPIFTSFCAFRPSW
jgi:hypothetical protein